MGMSDELPIQTVHGLFMNKLILYSNNSLINGILQHTVLLNQRCLQWSIYYKTNNRSSATC